MARKDERGVTAAPIRYNNPASVRLPRVDDEHRGPAVADAYELSTCRIDLMEVSRGWPLPDELPATLLALAQGVPEDQRQEWLRSETAREEVTRLISSAMRSGELPIWIAPKDGPDRLVAPSAMLEVDHATVVSGVYRPPNDRGWLYGRPLFVKHADWHRFVSDVQSRRNAQTPSHQRMAERNAIGGTSQGPIDRSNADPAFIALHDALRELHQRVTAAVTDADPAPWAEVSPFLVEMFSEGDDTAFIRRKKMEERSKLTLQQGLLSGALRARFSDGANTLEVPGWAWEGTQRSEHVWFTGRLPLEIFLPDEWQRWSCHSVILDREAFSGWLERQDLADVGGLPKLPPPHDASSKPQPVKKRRPPDIPYVTLSEALTWIAFGFAIGRDDLDRAISERAFGELDPERALTGAMARLTECGSGGQIALRGKYLESHAVDENKVLTELIEPIRLEDFAQFDILYDGLHYGTGLTWEKGGSGLERVLNDRRDAYRSVKVNRAHLMKIFPDPDDTARASMLALPAYLPGIGPVMRLEEALSWLAHNRPSFDIGIWQNPAGEMVFRHPDGSVVQPDPDGALPPFMETHRQASRVLHGALRDGSLPSYVAPSESPALTVPRFYWNGVNPDGLDHVYRGMSPSDPGEGCVILLSRIEFDTWRAGLAPLRTPERPRPSHNDVVAWCQRWIAEGRGNGMDRAWAAFRRDPNHSGLSRDDVFRPAWKEAKTQ